VWSAKQPECYLIEKLGGNMPLETPGKPAEEQPASKSRNNNSTKQLLQLAGSIVVVGLLGALVWEFMLQDECVPGREHNAVLGITIFIQAMIAFFGILNLEEPHSATVTPIKKGQMRSAIAGAVIVAYISLVTFHAVVEFGTGNPTNSDPFVNSFTQVVSVTIIFYFASEATIHWINNKSQTGESGQ
jgi:hypothetical protein